jgi:hypothetical protein
MAGTGKHLALQECLKQIATLRNLPYTLQTKCIDGSGGGDEEEEEVTNQITYEQSHVHTGFDIARMSMQDKQILRPIFSSLGQGSQVLAGEQGRGSRILVLYHAHLLSSESVLLLQACLEQNEGDVSIWLTSELPVPQRIRDWFVEVPCSGNDTSFIKFSKHLPDPANWPDVFNKLFTRWLKLPPPKIQDIKEVKAFVYELLMRNLRWVEATHFLLDVVLLHPHMTDMQRRSCMKALAICEATAGGYTIPSYRIPVLWESLFLQLRNILFRAEE